MADSRILHRAAGRRWEHLGAEAIWQFKQNTRFSAVYVLYRGPDVVYVGRTDMLLFRLRTHRRLIGYDSFKACLLPSREEAKWLERKLIFRLKPSVNRLIPTSLFAEFYGLHRRRTA